MEHHSLRELCWVNLEAYKKALEKGTSFHRASLGNLEEGSYAGGLGVEEHSGTGISPHRNPVGEPGEGVPSTGTFEN